MWAFPDDLTLSDGRSEPLPLAERWAVARGDLTGLASPPRFVIDRPGKPGDLVWTANMLKVAPSRFLDVLSDVGASGWDSHPVEIIDRHGEVLDGFHLLAVVGETDESTLNYDPATVNAMYDDAWEVSGFDVTVGWDGSDVFWIGGRAGSSFLATDEVARALTAAGLSGFERTRATEHVAQINPQLMGPRGTA